MKYPEIPVLLESDHEWRKLRKDDVEDEQQLQNDQHQEKCDCTGRGHAWDHWQSDHRPESLKSRILAGLLEEAIGDLDRCLENKWTTACTSGRGQDATRAKAQTERQESMERYREQFGIKISDALTTNPLEADRTDDELFQNDLVREWSLESVVSTASAFACDQMTAQARNDGNLSFRPVGAGSTGVVFAQEGMSRVFKIAKHNPRALRNDYDMHKRLHTAFESHPVPGIAIPRPRQFVEEGEDEFFDDLPELTDMAKAARIRLPTTVIVSDLVLPLPEPMRQGLIEKYCDETLKKQALSTPVNQNCLARVYLGKSDTVVNRHHQQTSSKPRPRFFTLLNFPMYSTRLREMGLDRNMLAQCMGRALAVMHWKAGVAGRDVEFVLGSSSIKLDPEVHFAVTEYKEDFHHRSIQLFILDFNLVKELPRNSAGIDQAVNAWKMNDPYFPKTRWSENAMIGHWFVFMRSYLRESSEILRHEQLEVRLLPFIFIHRIRENKETDRLPHVLGQFYDLLSASWRVYGISEPPAWLDAEQCESSLESDEALMEEEEEEEEEDDV